MILFIINAVRSNEWLNVKFFRRIKNKSHNALNNAEKKRKNPVNHYYFYHAFFFFFFIFKCYEILHKGLGL